MLPALRGLQGIFPECCLKSVELTSPFFEVSTNLHDRNIASYIKCRLILGIKISMAVSGSH